MIDAHDRNILRELAREVADIAAQPVMDERIALWKQHNRLRPVRPMILIFPEGAWGELLTDRDMKCTQEDARGIEWVLRAQVYQHRHFDSDNVVVREWPVGKVLHSTGWGLEAKWRHSAETRGARGFDPVIASPADLSKLRHPEVSLDEAETGRRLAAAQDLFGDILDVRLRGVTHLSFHLMSLYTSLRGLEQVMMDMVEEPRMLHDAMAFLEEGHRKLVEQYVVLNVLDLNNDNTYHSSGGVGFTDELPAPGFSPGRVRPCDMWSSAEAQELAQVSPAHHAEFILQYEKRLLEPFGLNGYGCCEDLTGKLDDVLRIPNIRRISISPWANVDRCAEKLGGKCIFSWKPHPSHLVGDFDEAKIRAYIAHTVQVAREHGCALEMILKDTHTCEHRPERFDAWCRLAREAIAAG